MARVLVIPGTTGGALLGLGLDLTNATRRAIGGTVDSEGGGGTSQNGVAPQLSAAEASASSPTTADLSVSTDQGAGTLYWVIATSDADPLATQVAAGDDATGAAAAAHGSQDVSAAGIQTVLATGLTASTTYYPYFLHSNANGLLSAVVAAPPFTTAALSPLDAPVLTQTSAAGVSPYTWDEAIDTTAYAGVTRRLQLASDAAFTNVEHDLFKPVLENELATSDASWSATADVPPRNYATDAIEALPPPSGSFYIRERLERDDGVVSAWSNTLHDDLEQVTAWKISVTANIHGNGGFAAAEIEWQDIDGNPLTAGGTASGADAGSATYNAAKAIDGSLTTYFLSSTANPAEHVMTWAANTAARKLKLVAPVNDGVFNKADDLPTAFDVKKFVGGQWVQVAHFTESTASTANQVRIYSW